MAASESYDNFSTFALRGSKGLKSAPCLSGLSLMVGWMLFLDEDLVVILVLGGDEE